MSAKYSRIPSSDPDYVSISFDSIHKFDSGQDYKKAHEYGRGQFEKGTFKSAFTYAGGFDPHKKIETVDIVEPSAACKLCSQVVIVFSFILLALTFPISAWFSFKNIQTYERLVIFRLGRLVAAKGPGLVIVVPFIDTTTKVDLRMRAFSVPPQKVLTTDGATIEVGAEMYYRVKDAVKSVGNVQDLNHSTRVISEITLQKHLSKYELSDINNNKTTIAHSLVLDINEMTLTWGTELTRATLSQVKVIAEPNNSGAQNPYNVLGPLLFPQGSSNPPIEQLANVMTAGATGGAAGVAGRAGGTPGMGQIDPSVFSIVQQEQFEQLQKQHPHLQKEIVYLMQHQGQEAIGASGPAAITGGVGAPCPVEILERVVPKLSSELVARFMCVYKFVVTGEQGGVFFLDLKHDEGEADEGEPRHGPADVTVTLTSANLQMLLTGKLSPFSAYMTGQIEVDGDVGMASKLGELVDLIK